MIAGNPPATPASSKQSHENNEDDEAARGHAGVASRAAAISHERDVLKLDEFERDMKAPRPAQQSQREREGDDTGL